MPIYVIEQYEVHTQKYRIEAKTEADAIKILFDGNADAVDDSLEFIEVCDDLGLPTDEYPELAEKLGITDDVIPSIRSIEEAALYPPGHQTLEEDHV